MKKLRQDKWNYSIRVANQSNICIFIVSCNGHWIINKNIKTIVFCQIQLHLKQIIREWLRISHHKTLPQCTEDSSEVSDFYWISPPTMLLNQWLLQHHFSQTIFHPLRSCIRYRLDCPTSQPKSTKFIWVYSWCQQLTTDFKSSFTQKLSRVSIQTWQTHHKQQISFSQPCRIPRL